MSQISPQRRAVSTAGWLLWVWLLLIPGLLSPGSAQASPALTLDQAFNSSDLGGYLDILEDPSNQLGFADISRAPIVNTFRPASIADLDMRPQDTGVWLRFAVRNNLPEVQPLVLRAPAEPGIFTLYDEKGRVLAPVLRPDIAPLFQIPAPAGERALYYLHLKPASPLPIQLELYTLDGYLGTQHTQNQLANLGAGALLALLVLTLVGALMTRDSLYLWLAGYGLLNLLPNIGQWLEPLPVYELRFVIMTQLIAVVCTLRMTLLFPACPDNNRPWRHTLVALIWLDMLMAVLIATLPMSSTLYWLSRSLLLATIALTVACGLHAYLMHHQRLVLGYALARLWILLSGTAVAFAQGQYSPGHELTRLLLLVATVEHAGLLCLLLLRTFRRRDQEATQQRAIAAAAAESRARTEIIAEVGHRIRTPVSGALGMLEMLQDTPLSATQRDYVGTIQRAGNELLNVVNDLSDVSKLEARPGELEQTTFDPHVLVAECVDGFRGLAEARRLELINDPAPELPAYVSGDPTRLRQILLQLLHHAVGHCEQGEIVIQVRPLPEHWLRFQINTAAQAPQDDAAISAMDRRLNPPGASGLRLGVARQLAETLGGRMQLREPSPGMLEAWFELPLPAAGQHIQPPVDQEPALRNKQLLVLDDNLTFCEVLRRQAGHWGMVVHTATNASEALARLRNQFTLGQSIDALLLDADMQELEDGNWLERLHAEIDQLPVVIMLASRELAGVERLRRLGVRRMLLKPINHTSLKITLAEELSYPGQPAFKNPDLRYAPIRCLVAEDNAINTKVLLGMLNRLGVECTAVGNGLEAVEACQRQDYDIVLMDCDMPIMDGWEATRRIRETHANRGRPPTPIIALTANTLAELGERARQPLMDAHLVKPIHLLELRALLERWTGKLVPASEEAPA